MFLEGAGEAPRSVHFVSRDLVTVGQFALSGETGYGIYPSLSGRTAVEGLRTGGNGQQDKETGGKGLHSSVPDLRYDTRFWKQRQVSDCPLKEENDKA